MSHLLCVGLQLLNPLHTPGTTCFSCLHHAVGSAPPSTAPSANLSCEHPPRSACPPWDASACQRPFPTALLGSGCWCQATGACPLGTAWSCLISPPVPWMQAALPEPPRHLSWSSSYPVWGHSLAHILSSAHRIPMQDKLQGRPSGHTGDEQTSAECGAEQIGKLS